MVATVVATVMMVELISDWKKPLSWRVVKLAKVTGLASSGGTEAASTGRLNAVRMIHRNGTNTRTRPAASRAIRMPSSVLLRTENSPLLSASAEDQVDQPDRDSDHDDQHHAHRSRVTDLLVLQSRVVDIQVERRAGDPGPAGGQDLDALELAVALDQPQDHDDEQDRAQRGQRDVPEHLEPV